MEKESEQRWVRKHKRRTCALFSEKGRLYGLLTALYTTYGYCATSVNLYIQPIEGVGTRRERTKWADWLRWWMIDSVSAHWRQRPEAGQRVSGFTGRFRICAHWRTVSPVLPAVLCIPAAISRENRPNSFISLHVFISFVSIIIYLKLTTCKYGNL